MSAKVILDHFVLHSTGMEAFSGRYRLLFVGYRRGPSLHLVSSSVSAFTFIFTLAFAIIFIIVIVNIVSTFQGMEFL